MKKFILTLFFVLTALQPLAAREQVWFIPGWFSADFTYEPHRQQLALIYPDSDVTICCWDSSRLWPQAKKNAELFAAVLAEKVAASPNPAKLTLVGHSLGGFILSHLAPILKQKQIRVKSMVYLGAAINAEHPGIDAAREVSIKPVLNFFSYGDGILKYLYVNAERNLPLGLTGVASPRKNMRQYHVETDISFNWKESYEECFNHLASKYLAAMLQLKPHSSPQEYYMDFREFENIASRNAVSFKNIAIPQIYELPKIKSANGWFVSKIEIKNRFFSPTIWMLISPIGNHYLYYRYADAEENFNDIQLRLKRK